MQAVSICAQHASCLPSSDLSSDLSFDLSSDLSFCPWAVYFPIASGLSFMLPLVIPDIVDGINTKMQLCKVAAVALSCGD